MKNIIITAIVMATIITACNSNHKSNNTAAKTDANDSTSVYACTMHPEVTGKKGAECSKCGMELTVPVKTKDTTLTK